VVYDSGMFGGLLLVLLAAAPAPASAPGDGPEGPLPEGVVRGAVPWPDTSLWSPVRIKAFAASQSIPGPAPVAVLAIPKIHLEVTVRDGTDEVALNRGVGLVEDSARPGERGNTAIAGHRDGYFRGLKDLAVGDEISLRTTAGAHLYVVKSIFVVNPEDSWVLDDGPTDTLTLVTCYPFYFVGSAPQRYVVRAERSDR
jgi:sortase A